MKLKLVVVDLELSRRQRMLGAAGLGAAILMVGAVAVADVPNTFVAGGTLTAASLNENFDDIDTRTSTLEGTASDLGVDVDALDTRTLALEGQLVQGSCTVDNGNANRVTPAGFDCGFGMIPPGALVSGITVRSGLQDGCEVTVRVNFVHLAGFPRILSEVHGISDNACADVGTIELGFVYLVP